MIYFDRRVFMVRQSLVVMTLLMGLAGCAAMEGPGKSPVSSAPPETFAHRVATSEVVLLWNCQRPEPGLLRLDGVAQSPWQAQPIRYLEFELVGVDTQERTITQTGGAARDLQIFTNQSTPFQLNLKTAGTEVRFDLYYHYRFDQEFDSAMLAGPPIVRPRLFAQTQTFLARDICADAKHRAR
jgi:hypothetical protein